MKKLLVFISLILISMSAAADAVPLDDVSVVAIITQSMVPATNMLLTQSMLWLGAFFSIQFVVTNAGLIRSGADIEAIIGRLAGSIAWLGFCLYVLQNGPAFIGDVGNQFFNMVGMSLPSPGSIILSTAGLVAGLAALAVAVGALNDAAAQIIIYALLFLFGVGMFFAVKIFMLQLELGLIIMLSPLSFSFLGLNALKDQGIAPFKALISLGYRILLITIILSAFTQVGNTVVTILKNYSSAADVIQNGVAIFIKTILGAIGAYVMLAYVLHRSDSIAAMLASGGTNMGTSDVSTSAAAGGAAGAAIGSGGGIVASKVGLPMSDVLKNMMGGGGGSIANASPLGTGGTSNPPPPPPKTPEMSLKQMQDHPSNIANQGGKSAGAGSSAPAPSSESSPGRAANTPVTPVSDPSAPPVTPSGSDSNAGIGGAGSDTDKKLDKLLEGRAPTFGDHASKLNDHIGREQATTHVSINANAE